MYDFKHLTSKTLQQNLRLRSKVLFHIREYFFNKGFLEISTPILSFPTKEYGDGEYIVLSKLHSSKCYSLPHSPQLYKQFLVACMGGNAKYFQLASNFRPEPGDATHVQEFQQLDFEIAKATVETIQNVVSDVIKLAFSAIGAKVHFIQLDYDESIRLYGNDSPDLRHESVIESATNNNIYITFKRDDIINLKKFREIVASYNTFDIIESSHALQIQGAHKQRHLLGDIRSVLISNDILRLCNKWSFVWLTNLPLFSTGNNNSIKTYHHPQMSPAQNNNQDLGKLQRTELLKLRGAGCDLIINGIEVAGGNVRNNNYQIQKQILKITGCANHEIATTYKPLLTLLKNFPNYSSGGAAIGFDRMMMLLTNNKNIRDAQPFPMSPDGKDFMGGPWQTAEGEIIY